MRYIDTEKRILLCVIDLRPNTAHDHVYYILKPCDCKPLAVSQFEKRLMEGPPDGATPSYKAVIVSRYFHYNCMIHIVDLI